MLQFMNVARISMSTFINHQNYYLYPSIAHVWQRYQDAYFDDVLNTDQAVNLAGDGRADTPGHSAKYGCYSVLDLDEGTVVGIQLVQVLSLIYMYFKYLRFEVNVNMWHQYCPYTDIINIQTYLIY